MEPEVSLQKTTLNHWLHAAVSRPHIEGEARAARHQDCVRALNLGAQVNASQNGGFVLERAALRGELDLCKLFIERGAKVDARFRNGPTALIQAATVGHAAICHLLIEHGANVNAQDSSGNSSLHLAALKGETGICRELIQAGANLESRDANRHTPLHFAACYEHADVCQLLLEHGADINAENVDGYTPERCLEYRASSFPNRKPGNDAATKGVFEAYRLNERLEANTAPTLASWSPSPPQADPASAQIDTDDMPVLRQRPMRL